MHTSVLLENDTKEGARFHGIFFEYFLYTYMHETLRPLKFLYKFELIT